MPAQAMARGLIRKYGPIYELPNESPIVKRLLDYETVTYGVKNISTIEAAHLVMELLFSLMASGQTHSENTDPAIDLVRRAIHLIDADGDTSVQDIARQLGVSREHLSRSFQRCLGISARQFSLENRIRRACLLLKENKKPIKVIADELGYADYSNFVHAFRQVMKMSPAAFRKTGHVPLPLPQIDGLDT